MMAPAIPRLVAEEPGATSVVVPVFNGARFLAEALDSVRAQSVPVAEVIVVDDGSTDDTAALVEAMGDVTLLRQDNAGPAAARNRGLAHARGEYVALLDADDLWTPDRQEILLGHLLDRPGTDLVIGHQRLLVEPGATLPAWVPEGDPETLGPADLPFPTTGFLARRALFDAVGGFAEDMLHGEDSDWFMRAHDRGAGVARVDDVVLVRRLHGGNLTHDTDAQRRAFFEVVARRMARRRAAAATVDPGADQRVEGAGR